ncbi:MAG: hemerythrin domain-containing protein [Polyangiales bacterium]
MSEDTLMPSEVRRRVLTQHREIETMLAELEQGAAKLVEGGAIVEKVKRAAYALRGILELHLRFEERYMVPAISEADGFGPERARHLHSEHAEQRAHLDQLVHSILEAEAPEAIQGGVSKLAEMLRADIEEEEQHYVNDKLLRDDIIPTDTFGG